MLEGKKNGVMMSDLDVIRRLEKELGTDYPSVTESIGISEDIQKMDKDKLLS